jgi:N-acetylmuramoyl-L-alanine amidase
MWFNPLVWMMKKSVQLVHEYLADEGVLNTGTDKLRYQALLINQVAEERLICLSSSFNHSLIKKRMIMMTKSKFNKGSKLRILTLIPLAAMLFVGVAFVNGQEVDKNSKVFTVIIDAGHGGKDAGAKLNDKIIEKDITLSIAKILKEKSSANTKLNLIFTREKDEFLELNKRIASDADLLISIHANFVENTDVSGIECFVAKESEFKEKSETFGKLIVTELNQLNGIKTTTSVNEADFFILKESQCPAILLIIGYLSNPDDLSFINDKSNQGLICDKILTAISQ